MNVKNQTTFPQVEGRSLTGIEYKLPHDFKGEVNLVVIGFYQWQQLICDMWLEYAKELSQRYERFCYYEIPLLDNKPTVIEDILYGDLIESIESENTRSKIITLYARKDDIFKEFGVLNSRKVGALLLSKDGNIIWQCQGFPSEKLKKELHDELHHELIVERL